MATTKMTFSLRNLGAPFHALRARTLIIAAIGLVLCAGAVLAQVLQQSNPVPLVKLAAPVAPPVTMTEAAPVPAPPPAPVTLDTLTVQRGDIEQTVIAAGKLQLFHYADANAQVAGQVKQVLFGIGDKVKSGQMMIEITPTLQPARAENNRAQMARLEAELADQRGQLDFAQLQFKRQTQLKAQNATREENFEASRMSMSSASARVDAILAQIRQVEATLKMDEENRQLTQVLAPMSGTVLALNARQGQAVNLLQPGAPLMRIADLSKMTVQARVAESDVTRLREGMTAYFTTPGYPGQRWSGKLRQVIPLPADDSGEHGQQAFYNVLFEVDNPQQKLMSGMSTQVQFVIAKARNAVLLPAARLGLPDKEGLYSANVVGDDLAISARKLKIGIQNQQQVQVLSGLAAGEKLLIGPVPAGSTTELSIGPVRTGSASVDKNTPAKTASKATATAILAPQ
ncbi:MAG: macrolide-specific efflux system membrane fusion protein [Janthinobacterium sp.]|jgi:macrolide-specific efflux system membrane fusion protein